MQSKVHLRGVFREPVSLIFLIMNFWEYKYIKMDLKTPIFHIFLEFLTPIFY